MSERAFDEGLSSGAATIRDWLRIVSLAVAVLGLFVASYLAYVELVGGVENMSCPANEQKIFGLPIDCGNVNVSEYAKLGPLPVALMGVGGYLCILLVLALEDRVPLPMEYGRLMLFGLTLFGFAFSMYLTWAEVTQIKAFCTWCMASAALMTVLFVIAVIRLWQSFNEGLEEYDEVYDPE